MSKSILSSTASRAYWLGRYLERTDNTSRLIAAHTNLLIDLPLRLPLGWQILVEALGVEASFAEHYGDAEERNVCRFLINDPRNLSSLVAASALAKENARTLQGVLPRTAVEYVNELFLHVKASLSEPLSRSRRQSGLLRVCQIVQRCEGYLSTDMLHDSEWHFLRLGMFIERADMTSRVLDLGLGAATQPSADPSTPADLAPFNDMRWRSVLRSLGASQNYNSVLQAPIEQTQVLQFLLGHDSLPRSVSYCVNSAKRSLGTLPHNAEPISHANRLSRLLRRTRIDKLSDRQLHGFMDKCQSQLAKLHNSIASSYFD